MVSADSNVVLRLLVRDDEEQYRIARSFLRSADGVFVSHVVLAQVVSTLIAAYGFPQPRVVTAVERLLDTDGVMIQDPEVVKTALQDYARSKADFGDCLILAIAGKQGALPLATFDVALSKLPGTRQLSKKGS
ncbi:MAG: type II toxin-antitoxin system VapC family toxin [Polyangiaceae bacterium]